MSASEFETIALAALAEVSERRSSWRRGHLVMEIARLLPLGMAASAEQIVALTNAKADELLARVGVTLVGVADDGVTQLSTTAEALADELAVVEWASDAVESFHGARTVEQMKQRVSHFAERELSSGQLQAAAVGDVAFELIDGPAGTGKTTALKAAVDSLRAEGRAVFGLAPSAVAALVARAETGCVTGT